MSAVIQTTTPFAVEEVLLEALQIVEADPVKATRELLSSTPRNHRIQLGDILTNRSDYFGLQLFRQVNGRWVLQHDNDEGSGRISLSSVGRKEYEPVSRFLANLGAVYNSAFAAYEEKLAEQERLRLEIERKARVESVRKQAVDKARAQGYAVKESRVGDKIQLVLTRTI